MNFGERIKELRIEKGWTQEYVAEKLHISVGALSRYETSMYEPKSLKLLMDFAELFDVTSDYLIGKTDKRDSNEKIQDPLGLAKIGFSMDNYNPPTEKQKEQIRDLLEIILKDNKRKDK